MSLYVYRLWKNFCRAKNALCYYAVSILLNTQQYKKCGFSFFNLKKVLATFIFIVLLSNCCVISEVSWRNKCESSVQGEKICFNFFNDLSYLCNLGEQKLCWSTDLTQ